MKKFSNLKYIIFPILLSFLFIHSASAASLDLNVDKNILQTGEVLTLKISLNTEGESINTVEGDLKYDEELLQAEVINISGSFISFWVEKPNMKTPGTIHFSGIIPGGISTTQGEVLKVIFRAQKEGDTNLEINAAHLFLNDGQGSETNAKFSNASIKITESANGVLAPIIVEDSISPERFTIIRTKDQSIYDNKYFIAFSTVDKESGVDYYKICEFWSCVTGDSPFLLKNQTPFYRIVVNAYDINGNFTSSTLTSGWLILLLGFLLFIVFILVFVFYRRYFHFNKV